MNEADEESGIAKIVHVDEASARELRANLAVFARRSGSPEIRQMVASVLAVGIVGLAIDKLLSLAEAWLLRWRKPGL